MSFDADVIVDRRRLRRKIVFWRVFAVVAVVAALGALFSAAGEGSIFDKRTPHVARVTVSGLIRNDRDRLKLLEDIGKSSAVRAVILSIDSPGGTVTGAETLYNNLRRLAEKKPIVAVVEGLAASGAYIAAIGSDQIVASPNSLVGSIGVIVQYPNVSTLLKSVGVEVEEVKSSPLKAAPSPFEPTSPEARQALQAVVDSSYGWFRGLVRDRRNLDEAASQKVSDGRVWTGAQSLDLRLVDQLGDEKTARAWLKQTRGVSEDLPVRDWKRSRRATDELRLSTRLIAGFAEQIGLAPLAQAVRSGADGMGALDGLLAVWHPPAGQ